MKKLLFSILSFSLFTTAAFAQNQSISFEENEGYTLGSVINQNQWSNYGYLLDEYANVVNDDASVGERAVKVEANQEEEENWGGLVYSLQPMNKFIVSADVKFDGNMGSDYDMLSLYSEIGGEFEYICGYYFQFMGETSFGNDTSYVSPFEWTPNTWYNLKSDVNFDTREIKLYVNNNLVHTVSIPAEIESITEFDFEFDNYETGYTLDNVQIVDLSNLGTDELSSNQWSVFPNPVVNILRVNINENIKSLEVLDITGKSLKTNYNSNTINVQELPEGNYILKVATDNQVKTKKFIKR